jgi:dUTP pyrophosphatase
MSTNPPTAPTIYLAEAIDRAQGTSHDGHKLARELSDCGLAVFRPATAWKGGQHAPAAVEHVNRAALYGSNTIVADLRGSIYTIGVPCEIEAATARGIPAVVLWEHDRPRSVVLQANPLVYWADSNSAAVAEALHLATQHRKAAPAGPEPLRFTIAAGAEPPTMAFVDDAGLDLVTAVDTEIPPGTFVDIPTTITGVQCPRGVWLEIAPRSSTIRKRGLLVPKGVIDHGWRGPLMAGVWNLGTETVVVKAGERVAQAILHHGVTERHPVQVVTELEPHSRGLAGFGSSGA